jgi:hypothetical protein
MKRFLSELWNWFKKSLGPNDGPFVHEGGDVARFVFRERDLDSHGCPKAKVFRADFHPKLQRYETSVCGLTAVTRDRVWQLGASLRAKEQLRAVAAVQVSVARIRQATNLWCESAPEPNYAEHGVILGWHAEPTDKAARIAAELELVALVSAEQVIRPA